MKINLFGSLVTSWRSAKARRLFSKATQHSNLLQGAYDDFDVILDNSHLYSQEETDKAEEGVKKLNEKNQLLWDKYHTYAEKHGVSGD